MKKMTQDGKLVPMTAKEEAFFLVAMCISSAVYGIGLYKLYCLIF